MWQKLVTWSKKYFSHQNELHMAKLSYLAALKHFTDIDKNLSFRSKKYFFIKLSYIQLYYDFLLFWSILWNWQNTCNSSQKVFLSSNWAPLSYNKLFCCVEAFLMKFSKNLSFRSKKCFSLQNGPHIATLSSSALLKDFLWKWQKNLSFGTKKKFFSANWATQISLILYPPVCFNVKPLWLHLPFSLYDQARA